MLLACRVASCCAETNFLRSDSVRWTRRRSRNKRRKRLFMRICVSSCIDEPAVIKTQTGSVGDHKNFFASFKTHKVKERVQKQSESLPTHFWPNTPCSQTAHTCQPPASVCVCPTYECVMWTQPSTNAPPPRWRQSYQAFCHLHWSSAAASDQRARMSSLPN